MNQEYIQRIKNIEAELDRWLPANIESCITTQWMNDVFPGLGKEINASSLNALFTPLKDILSRGGKRWRPLLLTLVCETLGGGRSALPLAPLVEFCHNASLIHDDIEDDSDERRGKPAAHKIYGIDTAINSGSFFYFLSLCCIESFAGKNKDRIYKLWAEYMRKLHLGQAMDISWHRDIKFIPSIEEYYSMCEMKTGSLARLAAELGACAAGASEEAARLLGEAAEKLGVGFQILDDVKNLTTGIPGKKRGDDITEGKKSLPVLLYLHKYPEKQERIFHCFSEAKKNGITVPEVEEMIKILTEAGVLTEAEERAGSLVKETRGIFNSPQYAGFPAKEEGRALLDGLIDLIS
ncbi:MAG: polyprenyl synthetase family protein [Treponema sp.]|jgi:octaprenyl-diphosphate synthase|nr:polyprenyl synthetase family protein [Treponema sp.]